MTTTNAATRRQTIYVDTGTKAKQLLARLIQNPGPTSFDTEFVPNTDDMVLFQVAYKPEIRYVVRAEFLALFGDWIEGNEDTKPEMVYHHFPADHGSLLRQGIDARSTFHADTMILGWLVDENQFEYGLKEQSSRHLNWHRKGYEALFHYDIPGKKKPVILNPRLIMDGPLPEDAILWFMDMYACTREEVAARWRDIMIEYSADDVDSTLSLYQQHREVLTSYGYWPSGYEQDRLYTLTLMDVKDRGVLIDKGYTKEIQIKVERDQIRWLQVFRSLVGDPDLNPRSNNQLADLIERLGWPIRPDLVSAKTGKPSANREALKWWAEEHGITEAIALNEYRRAAFMNGNFLSSMLENTDEDGRIRTELKQTSSTGRIRSSKIYGIEFQEDDDGALSQVKSVRGMQLQNVPAARNDRWGVRGGFVAPLLGEYVNRGILAQEDYDLVVGDYGGFELYMAIYNAAKFSPNSEMLKYANKGANLHAMAAYRMGLVPNKFMPEATALIKNEEWKKFKALISEGLGDGGVIYNRGKVGNLSLLYGGGATMYTRMIGMNHNDQKDVEYGQSLIYAWQDSWPEIVLYQEKMPAFGLKYGYVPTIGGRRIHVGPGLTYKDKDEKKQKQVRSFWRRKSLNSPCQGCLPYDTQILTSDGFQKIGEAPQQGTVWTGTSWANYTRLNRGAWELAELTLANGQILTCDTRHQVLVKQETGTDFKHYNALEPGDTICLSAADRMQYGRTPAFDLEHAYWLGALVACGVSHVDGSVVITLQDYPELKEDKYTKLCRYIKKFWRGSYAFHTITDDDQCSVLQLTTRGQEAWMQWARDFGYAWGHSEQNKRLPLGICGASVEYREAFLAGFQDNTHSSTTVFGVHLYSDHRELLQEVQRLVRTVGQRSVLQEINSTRAYTLRIDNRVVSQDMTNHEYDTVALVSKRSLDIYADTYTLSVDSPLHRFDSEGVISKNSAADIVKVAMNMIEADPELQEMGFTQLLQVHDELIGQVPKRFAIEAKERMFHLMRQPYKNKLKFTLVVEGKTGPNWLVAK